MYCYRYILVLVLLTGNVYSQGFTAAELDAFFGCSSLGCTRDQYCIKNIFGSSRCSNHLVCETGSVCPSNRVCNVRVFPCSSSKCPYIENCENPCGALRCSAGKACTVRSGSPQCVDVCEVYQCEEGLKCSALQDEECRLVQDDCPLLPVCLNPDDVCLNYQCPDDYKCVPTREHCTGEECLARPDCIYDGHPCKDIECEAGYVCAESKPKNCEHCLREYKCVSKEAPCELYVCESGKVCQESTNHCIDIRLLNDGNDECQALPECVTIDDPCKGYSCPDGYHCQVDTNHCQEDQECHSWALCAKHVETCDDKQCSNGTVCEMQEQEDCQSQPCPEVPVCVAIQRQGRVLKNFFTNLKLAKTSKFQKISHEGKLGIFINESSILGLLSDLKEKLKNKTQKIVEGPTELPEDVDTLLSMILKPKPPPRHPQFTPIPPVSAPSRPHQPPLKPVRPYFVQQGPIPASSQSHRPFRVTPSNSIIYYQDYQPNRKVPSAHQPMPHPVPQGGYQRPHPQQKSAMSVYTRSYGSRPVGRTGDADDYSLQFNETEASENNTYTEETGFELDGASVALQDVDPFMIIRPAADGRTGEGEGMKYSIECGFDGVKLEIQSDGPFSGNVSYMEGMELCSTSPIANLSEMIIHIPYQSGCGDNIDIFSLQHYVQVDWESGEQAMLPVECYLESRSKLETGVSIDPQKTKSILDIQAETQQALLIFDKYGQPVKGNVRLGETVQLFFTVGMTIEHTFDADLMNCWATSDDGQARELIIKDGCPIHKEKIQGPNKQYKPNRMNKWNTYDITYIVKTYPINNSLNVKYSCDVRVCMPECTTKLYCGSQQRFRREEPSLVSDRSIMMEVQSESIHLV